MTLKAFIARCKSNYISEMNYHLHIFETKDELDSWEKREADHAKAIARLEAEARELRGIISLSGQDEIVKWLEQRNQAEGKLFAAYVAGVFDRYPAKELIGVLLRKRGLLKEGD